MRMLGSMIAALVVLAGCNTAEGLGKDLQQGGRAIESAARDLAN